MAEPQNAVVDTEVEEPYENEFKDAQSVEELLAQYGGAASMCWSNPSGAGEFQSDHLAFHMDEAIKRLQDLVRTALAEYVVESAGELAAFFPMFGLPGDRAEAIDEYDGDDEAEDEAEEAQPVTDEE